ncbi:hypothetical protein D6833_00105 [Candidatus Parcubacteria bacterium]|nr:MAG: hypothetical protein D6833_00105 [Candidatus Parcubacteria bacterium]
MAQFARFVGDLFYFKPVSMLRRAGVPTAQALADLIYKEEPDAQHPDLFQLRHRAEATFARELDRILEPVRGRFGVPKDVGERIIAGGRKKGVAWRAPWPLRGGIP